MHATGIKESTLALLSQAKLGPNKRRGVSTGVPKTSQFGQNGISVVLLPFLPSPPRAFSSSLYLPPPTLPLPLINLPPFPSTFFTLLSLHIFPLRPKKLDVAVNIAKMCRVGRSGCFSGHLAYYYFAFKHYRFIVVASVCLSALSRR